jgi:predicted signal transduction protein with EAL and GGDEF domain
MTVGTSSVQVSLSLGVATGKIAAEAEKLLHAADAAMYQAKNAGRNRVEPGRAESGRVESGMERPAGASQTSSVPNRDVG